MLLEPMSDLWVEWRMNRRFGRAHGLGFGLGHFGLGLILGVEGWASGHGDDIGRNLTDKGTNVRGSSVFLRGSYLNRSILGKALHREAQCRTRGHGPEGEISLKQNLIREYPLNHARLLLAAEALILNSLASEPPESLFLGRYLKLKWGT